MKYDVEADGVGAPPLQIPGLVWRNPLKKYHGWRPPEWVQPADPRETARQAHAEQLRDEALANVEPALVEAARRASAAAALAADALRQLEAEKSALTTDISDSAVLASLTIDRRIDAARRVVEQANARFDTSLAAVREALIGYFNQRILLRERERASELDDQAALLTRQAIDVRIGPITARSWLENWLPTSPPAPIQSAPAAQPAAVPARRKLFG